MLSYEEALARVLLDVTPLYAERVSLGDAPGRVLESDVLATRSIPEFDYSAMDGYAVASGSFPGAGPWTFPVRGEFRAGDAPGSFSPGSACRIFTGAPIPVGADAVGAQEDVTTAGGFATFTSRPSVGNHIRRTGEDLHLGRLALAKGTRLTAYQLGLLASLNQGHVVVTRRPRVTIVCTGDELTLPGAAGPPGTIPESNGPVLAALARHAGAQVELTPLARDTQSTLEKTFHALLPATDLLVTVGGVSVGDYDFVQAALCDAGGQIDFWKVALKPGKPLLYGRAGTARVLGLPGNPASAAVTFTLFGLPLLRKLQGAMRPELPFRKLPLVAEVRQRPGRRGFYACALEGDALRPLANQASGAPTSLAWADGLLTLPADSEGAAAGSLVDAILFRELGL